MTLVALFTMSTSTWADEVTIGDPTSTSSNSNLPGYSLNDYALSQQIYTADEIGTSGTITALTMWLKNNSSYARNYNIYMKEVSVSSFADGNSWVSMTESNLVASGTLNNGIQTPVETTFTLTTPFEYSGTGNLVICFQDATGSWSSGAASVIMDVAGNQAIYAYRDGTVYDVTNPGVTGTLLAKKSVVKLDITSSSKVEISEDKSEASFDMPAYDATLEYDIVRNLASNTTLDVLINDEVIEADSRLCIVEDAETGDYMPIHTLSFSLTDNVEQKTLTAQEALDAGLKLVYYLLDDEENWIKVQTDPETGLPVDLEPDQVYCVTLMATNDSEYYGGETAPSFTLTTVEGFELEIPSKSFATFYKDKPLYVEKEYAELYTVSSVVGDKAYLSDVIEVAPTETPLLVYNNSEDTQYIVLIPAESEPNVALTVAPEFKGTLTSMSMPGSDDETTYYGCNKHDFVRIDDPGYVDANRCWIEISNSNARTLQIVFSDLTGVKEVKEVREVNDGDFYDLNGRKVNQPKRKGVYIQNGRKVIVK